MKKSCVLICFFSSSLTWGQNCSFSYKELIDGFFAQYVNRESHASLDSMDILIWDAKDAISTKRDSSNFYLCPNPDLHKVGDITLPTSTFVYIDEKDEQGHEMHVLYWMSPRQQTEKYKKIKKILCSRYGCITLNDSSTLIPAKWYSGKMDFLESPFLYGNQFVSKRLNSVTLKNGIYSSEDNTQPAFYSQWKTGGDLQHTISMIESIQENGRRISGEPINKSSEREKMLYLFGREVSLHIDFSFFEKNYRSKEYTVMLRLDETLKAHLYVLLPKDLTTEDRFLLTAVSMAVELQPAGIFSGYWCSRGLYPAIFLKLTVSERSGCTFRDYNNKINYK